MENKTDEQIEQIGKRVLLKVEKKLKRKKARRRLEANCKLFGEAPPEDVWRKRHNEMIKAKNPSQKYLEKRKKDKEKLIKKGFKMFDQHRKKIKEMQLNFYTNEEICKKLGYKKTNASCALSAYLQKYPIIKKRYLLKKNKLNYVVKRAREVIDMYRSGVGPLKIAEHLKGKYPKEITMHKSVVYSRIKSLLKKYRETPKFYQGVKNRTDYFY